MSRTLGSYIGPPESEAERYRVRAWNDAGVAGEFDIYACSEQEAMRIAVQKHNLKNEIVGIIKEAD